MHGQIGQRIDKDRGNVFLSLRKIENNIKDADDDNTKKLMTVARQVFQGYLKKKHKTAKKRYYVRYITL